MSPQAVSERSALEGPKPSPLLPPSPSPASAAPLPLLPPAPSPASAAPLPPLPAAPLALAPLLLAPPALLPWGASSAATLLPLPTQHRPW